MKRFLLVALLCSLLLVSSALSENVNMGIATQALLDDFASYRESIGLKGYPTNLFERELNAKHVNLQISDYCRIDIHQQDGYVVDFTVLTDDVAQTDASVQDIIITFTGIMLVSNPEIDTSNALDLFSGMVENSEDVTIGGITYHYSTSQPFTNIIALQANLAK